MRRGTRSLPSLLLMLLAFVALLAIWVFVGPLLQEDPTTSLFLGSIVFLTFVYFATRMFRRRPGLTRFSALRVLTVLPCSSCSFKLVRNFSAGDYVHKEDSKCQQCGSPLYIKAIYAEEPKK